MVEKLYEYQGMYGRLHHVRSLLSEKVDEWREDHPGGIKGIAMGLLRRDKPDVMTEETIEDFPHIYRRKTRAELVRISAAVMGIEFSYAAETAFVSPTLLKIGVDHSHMTLVWGLSPLIGFFLTPLLGSLSDRCKFRMGRRRPFILLLACGVLTGLILVPNGQSMGHALGDYYPSMDSDYPVRNFVTAKTKNITDNVTLLSDAQYSHPWGVFFTVLGTVLLDFDADACQSPSRSYLLDVTLPEDHAKGLSTFTIMAGLGGFIGYALGGTDWDATSIGMMFGGHVRAVFSLITVLFVICVACTVTSFSEIPLEILDKERGRHAAKQRLASENLETRRISLTKEQEYGATGEFTEGDRLPGGKESDVSQEDRVPSLKEYLLSVVFMPRSLRMICLTNLFSWMAHVCYSLYFTDFVGEAVFNGDPMAPVSSERYQLYEEGVRFGCWGLSMYSLSCSCYSVIIEGLIKRFRAKNVYIGGLLCYSIGMMLMALTKHKAGVIIFSWTAGVMYSTLFTMPYLLVAHYHSTGVFEITQDGELKTETRLRGLGTDIAIVSSMVFLAQFILSLGMGSIVSWAGTTTAVVSVASVLAFCGGSVSRWTLVSWICCGPLTEDRRQRLILTSIGERLNKHISQETISQCY